MVPLAEIAVRQFGVAGEVEISKKISFLFLMGGVTIAQGPGQGIDNLRPL